jgi:hypothetical protein
MRKKWERQAEKVAAYQVGGEVIRVHSFPDPSSVLKENCS